MHRFLTIAAALLCLSTTAQATQAQSSDPPPADGNAAPLYMQAWLALWPEADEIEIAKGDATDQQRNRARRLLGLESIASGIRLFIAASRREACDFTLPVDVADESVVIRSNGFRIRPMARLLMLDAERCIEQRDITGAATRYATLVRAADHAAQGACQKPPEFADPWLDILEAMAVAHAGVDGLHRLAAKHELDDDALAEITDAQARLIAEDPMSLRAGLRAEANSASPVGTAEGLLDRLMEARQRARIQAEVRRVLERMDTADDPVSSLHDLHKELSAARGSNPLAGTYAKGAADMLVLLQQLQAQLAEITGQTPDDENPPPG